MSGLRKRDLALALLAVAALWQGAAVLLAKPVLPRPLPVAIALWRELPAGLAQHAAVSLARVAGGILLATLGAVPLGLLMAQSRLAQRVCSPLIYLLYPIPKVVFVPVILLLFGVGDLPKILLIALILFTQILVLVRDSAAAIRPELLTSVRSLGAGPVALLWFVYAPASLPAVLSALRQSVGTALAVLYIAELFATRWGLGYYIHLNGTTLMDYPAMYAGIVVMGVLGLALFIGIDLAEKRLCPWRLEDPAGPARSSAARS
jgi:NitT/TauT family transport system permease protein